jgi:hypothetical protein
LAPQTAMASLSVAAAVAPVKTQPLPLGAVANGLSWGVCILAIGVWLVLLGVLVRTIKGIHASAGTAKGGRPVA